MGIVADLKRLGIKLDDEDRDEIEKIVQRVTKQQKDKSIRDAVIEGEVGDFLNAWRPDVMEEIVKDKQKQSDDWVKMTQRKFDAKGNRICDEQFCPSTAGVAQCVYCGKYVCDEHNYMKETRCCYDCYAEKVGKENV